MTPTDGMHRRYCATLFLWIAAITWIQAWEAPQRDLLQLPIGPGTVLPDLAKDDWMRLSWLPGIGVEKARHIVSIRPHLGFRLTPGRLHLIPGIGPRTAQKVQDWYRLGGQEPNTLEARFPAKP